MRRRVRTTKEAGHCGYAKLTSVLLLAALTACAAAADLSQYRGFALGGKIADIAQRINKTEDQARIIQQRPALIQDLEWRPQSLSSSITSEPVKEVTFRFYEGELSRIVVNYDRYQTAGLKDSDLVEAISETYGPASLPGTKPAREVRGIYGSLDALLAEWQDTEYRYELIRLPYGPSYRLVGHLKRLEEPVKDSIQEARRLDDLEAPQRELDRVAEELEAAEAKDAAARAVNKERFRP